MPVAVPSAVSDLLLTASTRILTAGTTGEETDPGATPAPLPSPEEILRGFTEQVRSEPCTRDDLSICGLALRVTGDVNVAQIIAWLLGAPLRILFLIAVGWLLRRILHRLIDRLANRAAAGPALPRPGGTATNAPPAASSPLLTSRREQRARTLASVLRSITTGVIGTIVVVMTLAELGFNVAPLLASAGVAGVALGFGCQSLVRDFLSGIFMIIEDQYGVGDVVDVGEASGTVEAVGLRVTRIRDVNGTLWYVRNGEILRVGNQSQGWSRAVLDINIGHGEDIGRAESILLESARELRSDERFSAAILGDPEVWGVEALTQEAVVVRLVVKTQPLQQWKVARELRRRIKERFDAAGLQMAVPRTVVMREDEHDAPEPPHESAASRDELGR